MILTNSTHWSRAFIRRMMRWVAREIHLPLREIRQATYRSSDRVTFRGRAYLGTGRFLVRIGRTGFPVKIAGYTRAHRDPVTGEYETYHDPVEALVGVTAHELAHLQHAAHGKTSGRGMEDIACARERYVLRRFRVERERLLWLWSATTAVSPTILPTVTPIIERRSAKAAAMLKKWESKLKRAKNKVARYQRLVKYYERANKQTTRKAADKG